MNNIQNIINSLNKKEIRFLEKYILSITKTGRKLSLFRLIKNGRNIDEKKISEILYNESPTNNIKKLKERLLQDIEDVILLRYNRNNSENIYAQNKSNSITLLLLANYYLDNGLLNEANKKLRKVKKLIQNHDYIFLEFIYNQIHCDYLERIGSKELGQELVKSFQILSELQFIQSLKIKNSMINSSSLKFNSDLCPIKKVNVEYGFYADFLDKLTQLKHNIHIGNVSDADVLYGKLISQSTEETKKQPRKMQIDILIQKVKINLLNNLFQENVHLINKIQQLGIECENQLHDYIKYRLINYFMLGDYCICKNIIFYFFSDEKIKESQSEEIFNQWQYFNICLSFINGQYSNVLKLISQFPGQSSLSVNLSLNVRLLEIYTLLILNKVDLVSIKLVSLTQSLKRFDLVNIERYNYLTAKLAILISSQGGYISTISSELFLNKYSGNVNSIPHQDILGLELISIDFIEATLKSKKVKYQYAN